VIITISLNAFCAVAVIINLRSFSVYHYCIIIQNIQTYIFISKILEETVPTPATSSRRDRRVATSVVDASHRIYCCYKLLTPDTRHRVVTHPPAPSYQSDYLYLNHSLLPVYQTRSSLPPRRDRCRYSPRPHQSPQLSLNQV